MNKAQKAVIQKNLDAEEKTIRELKQVYARARKDCEEKIRALSARMELEPDNIASIIYQKQYQEALKKQIDSICDTLNSEQFSAIADYLQQSYYNGYTGVMYDLHQQGIPIIAPINQEQVVRALQTDSKISKGLYESMGEDTKRLKNSIRAELSRGASQGKSWNEVAVHIARGMNSPFNRAINRAILISRTEGHRIQQQSALDAQKAAKDKGAVIVKQWCATLDDRTRPEHQQLDGQIREVEEDFAVDGYSASAPGMFGDPSMDCNCRCCILQRSISALDEKELAILQERADYFGLDKSDQFEKFREKYLNLETSISVEQTQMITEKRISNAYSVDRRLVNTKQYHDKFEGLTEHKALNESAYQETMKILEHRDGTNSEDLKILDARSGIMIVENIQSKKPGSTGLTKEQYRLYQAHSGQKILLHNHPNGSRLSYTDIKTLFTNNDIAATIAVGHDGSVHIASKPNRDIDIEKLFELLYNDNKDRYNDSDVARVKALDDLYDMNLFSYESR